VFRRASASSEVCASLLGSCSAYTKPWTVTFKQAFMPDTELLDEICLENEKSYQHLPNK
jgi:hypothetical protein